MYDDTDINRVEDLNKKMYSTNPNALKKRRAGLLRKVDYIVPRGWSLKKSTKEIEQKLTVRQPRLRAFFLFSIVVLLGSVIFGLFMYYRGSRTISTDNVDITILGNSFTDGGKELPIEIQIKNNNTTDLELADLLVEYPRGSSGTLASDMNRTRKTIGTIAQGKTYTETSKLVLYGEQGTTREVKVSLQYRVKGSNAIFVKEKYYTVNINTAPLTITVDAPTTMSPNQEITLKIKASLNVDQVAQNMRLSVEYPPGFQYKSSSPEPRYGNSLWDLGDLKIGTEKVITVTGMLRGDEGQEQSFTVFAGAENPNDESAVGVIYNSLAHTVKLEKPFLQAKILVDGKNAPVQYARSRQSFPVSIVWSNNLPVLMKNVEITAVLSGNVIDKNSIDVQGGFYDSALGKIIWNQNTTETLGSVEPGESGQVNFTLKSGSLITANGIVTDPHITIAVNIQGSQVAAGGLDQLVTGVEDTSIRFISDIKIDGNALFGSGPFQNSGAMPPQADKKTTYTVQWNVSNTVNAVNDVEVRTTLPVYISWKNAISPSSENVAYNPVTREIVWKLGTMGKSSGATPVKRTLFFQVELRPSISQIGSNPLLVGETTLIGTDAYAGAMLRSQVKNISTRLIGDTGALINDGVVVQ